MFDSEHICMEPDFLSFLLFIAQKMLAKCSIWNNARVPAKEFRYLKSENMFLIIPKLQKTQEQEMHRGLI